MLFKNPFSLSPELLHMTSAIKEVGLSRTYKKNEDRTCLNNQNQAVHWERISQIKGGQIILKENVWSFYFQSKIDVEFF